MQDDQVGETRPRDAGTGQGDAGEHGVSLEPCRLEIDGKPVEAMAGETILAAARRAGIDIPAMCADPRMKPTGECELCNVVLDGQADHVKACMTVAEAGMTVRTGNPELTALRRDRLNTYLADHNAYCQPPCTAACPAGIDIAGYIDLILQKDYAGSTALIKEMLPLPGVLGRVCPRPCEDPCRRVQIDGKPVAICALKRFAADKAAESGLPTQPERSPPPANASPSLAPVPLASPQPTIWRLRGIRLRCWNRRRRRVACCASASRPTACPIMCSTRRSMTSCRSASS
jgi:ferredoxin